jgi:eukaryotic-like serine/threonine-protein kinase
MSLSTIQSTVGGRYQVFGRIASGGMGEVYRAHDAVLGREVALKVLHPQFAHDRGFVERFRREARAAAILNHHNIVGVYDWGSTEGTYYMVMEFISGFNLRALLAEHGRLEPRQVVEAATQILAALDHAHGHGIVHRDV